ncbi:MAG: copper chaperone PCu(A)C [Bosea sp. (in: a-proteobacteria)]|uniref:copper chaperone PCu(A)C n=1 Tax=Bosea sp. (in: a-proteobacteria) TaxID=1871050 RepID=UPI0027341951|nr:copper chaperone PCu(A)C [Bosea sp. (in: a-proteobacteria)]MDP3254680.1 copper chaperone PCu(A)C [Bosea sp. (in: a-proteobacteria)]MDP3321833.1 copper chaperone PCu(A)C [Bosea sp. (in: a-proteobacteria)]
MNKPVHYLAAAMLTLTSVVALAHDYTLGALKIDHPWTRATPGGAKVAGGYLTIQNGGSASDRLLGGSSEIAGRVEIHEMAVKDGIMTMRPLDKGLEVKPGEKAELKPGGFHIMFMDLKRPLKEGERVKGTLQFEKAGTVAVEFTVQAVGARDTGHKH